MPTLKKLAQRVARRIFLHRPEKLWVNYCFALFVIFCLIAATHLMNHTIAGRSQAAADAIKKSNARIETAHNIVLGATTLASGSDEDLPSFKKAVQQLNILNHELIVVEHILHRSEVDTLEFTGTIHQDLNRFINLAQLFMSRPPEQRFGLSRRLHEMFYLDGLRESLLKSTLLTVTSLENEASHFASLQIRLFIASAFVLLAEAFLIFLPAQRSVLGNIRKMERRTRELRRSQRRLKTANKQLEHMVLHHQLTGLPNRTSLTKLLGEAITNKGADEMNVLLVGLDDFKSVNDTMGHDLGDQLLLAVSKALKSCVDYDKIVAHVSGDEFVLISGEKTRFLIDRIMAALKKPFTVGGRRIPINASIGYLGVGDDAKQPLDILADAEIALQFAKTNGGNRAQAFTENLRDELGLMQRLQLELTDAILNGEIEPWFQPQVRLSDGRLHGAEVLARWRHPTRGLLTPDVFLPAAERAGLMIDVDHAIWKEAMKQARIWQRNDLWRPSISLNVAPDTIADPHLVERFLLELHLSGLEADQVILEVLETTLINGKDDIAAINIDSLADCGIALELDDFGTGYASLSKLTQLPLTGIKLDRSLVSPLPDQAADSVVRAILALATELGLHVVAEGVEENEQAAHLNERGCEIGQGYGFGKPMPPEEFRSWLADNAHLKLKAG